MEVHTPLNVEIVVSMDAKISKILSGNKFWMLVLLFTELNSKKSGKVLKTLPWVTTSLQSKDRVWLINHSCQPNMHMQIRSNETNVWSAYEVK